MSSRYSQDVSSITHFHSSWLGQWRKQMWTLQHAMREWIWGRSAKQDGCLCGFQMPRQVEPQRVNITTGAIRETHAQREGATCQSHCDLAHRLDKHCLRFVTCQWRCVHRPFPSPHVSSTQPFPVHQLDYIVNPPTPSPTRTGSLEHRP